MPERVPALPIVLAYIISITTLQAATRREYLGKPGGGWFNNTSRRGIAALGRGASFPLTKGETHGVVCAPARGRPQDLQRHRRRAQPPERQARDDRFRELR